MNLLSRRGFAVLGGVFPWLFGDEAQAQPTGTNTQPLIAGQYPGAATNNNASTGNIGEFLTAALASGSALQVSNGVSTSVIGISLTPGDWDVWGMATFHFQAATVCTQIACAVNTALSSTLPTLGSPALSQFGLGGGLTGMADTSLDCGVARISIAATATANIAAASSFSASTTAVYGTISARRAR